MTEPIDSNILFIRLDKIGDLICTLPSDRFFSNTNNHWVIAKGLEFIPTNSVPKRNFLALNKSHKLRSFFKISRLLKSKKWTAAISFQAPWWVNLALFINRVPIRIGVKSQWHSYLFLNHGLRQKRSRASMHESEYNSELSLHLIKLLKLPIPKTDSSTFLRIASSNSIDKTTLLTQFNLIPKKYFIVHPGMAGSALNWPIPNYIEFIYQFLEKHTDLKIAITGTLMDEPFLKDIKKEFISSQERVVVLQNRLSTLELLTILENSLGILAPSTGVLHIAASLGVTCYGIYSPIRVQSPKRWKPRGEKVYIFAPEVKCPSQFVCLKEKCSEFNCMEKIEVDSIIDQLEI